LLTSLFVIYIILGYFFWLCLCFSSSLVQCEYVHIFWNYQ